VTTGFAFSEHMTITTRGAPFIARTLPNGNDGGDLRASGGRACCRGRPIVRPVSVSNRPSVLRRYGSMIVPLGTNVAAYNSGGRSEFALFHRAVRGTLHCWAAFIRGFPPWLSPETTRRATRSSDAAHLTIFTFRELRPSDFCRPEIESSAANGLPSGPV
jgi:hypothetical protein